jgi:hypothetical protein
LKRKDLNTGLNFEGFLSFIIQVAFHVFSKFPKDISHLPTVMCIKALLKYFEEATKAKGQSILLYEDPESTSIADRDVIKALNNRLKENPDYALPEGFTKVQEKELDYEYKLPENFNEISESQKIGIEVLDSIFDDKFGFHIIEPIVSTRTINRVKPVIKKQINSQN